MSKRTFLFVIALVGALAMTMGAVFTPVASAHPTGNERRAVAGCQTLRPALRAPCRACVTRPRPHHFHPLMAAGQRCQPNNGQRRGR